MSSNIALGDNINQSIKGNNKFKKFIQELKDLGVPEEDINDVKTIIETTDKANIGKKIMNWLGKMTSKAIEKGIDLQIPVLLEKIQEIL